MVCIGTHSADNNISINIDIISKRLEILYLDRFPKLEEAPFKEIPDIPSMPAPAPDPVLNGKSNAVTMAIFQVT